MRKTIFLLLPVVLLSACSQKELSSSQLSISTSESSRSSSISESSSSTSPSSESSSSSEITSQRESKKNLIIFIGDGMSSSQLIAGKSLDTVPYSFMDWNHAEVDTNSYGTANDYANHTTNSAAAATAIATGALTLNGYIGKDRNGNDKETILDFAKSLGKSTGIVTNDKGYEATAASFSAHSLNRDLSDEITVSQSTSNVDMILARSSSTYANHESDFTSNGYTFITDFSKHDMTKIDKFIYQANPVEYGGNEKLVDLVKYSLPILSKDDDGFVLIVEQAYVDKYAHSNDFENMAKAIMSLNEAITYVDEVTDKNTSIIITGDHETGSLFISNENTLPNSCTLNDKTVYYSFDSTSHSKTKVPIYINKDFDFSSLPYYKDSQYIKNSDIFSIAKYLISENN